MTILERVIYYISLQEEGPTWDFKKEWHKDKGRLLHDIICMANTLSDEEGLIIIGVDEENNYAVIDVGENQYRKNTNDIVNFLRDKQFAGGVRPVAHVETLTIYGKKLDVIVVENSENVPFYLTEDFQCVKAAHIYTRVKDTNTPVDKTADADKVEALWRMHFGLDKPASQRFNILLREPDKWVSTDGEETFYNAVAPEYRIVMIRDENRHGKEYYCFSQINPSEGWYHVHLMYQSTIIKDTSGVCLDSGNFFTVVPDWDKIDGHALYSFIDDTISSNLNQMFLSKQSERNSYGNILWEQCVPTFKNKGEKYSFISYLKASHFMVNQGKILQEKERSRSADSMYLDYLISVKVVEELSRWRTTEFTKNGENAV